LYSGLQSITGIELSPNGELYFVDSNAHELFKLNIQNNVVSRITGDGEGDKNGYVSIAQFRYPRDIAVDAKGNLFIADEGNHKIRKIDTNGNVTTYAGSVEGYLEGAAHEAQFSFPYGIGVDNEGTIYVADTSNNSIRKIVQE
jgi:DNA-binding beta-propeller fold protein YncE